MANTILAAHHESRDPEVHAMTMRRREPNGFDGYAMRYGSAREQWCPCGPDCRQDRRWEHVRTTIVFAGPRLIPPDLVCRKA